MPKSGPRSPKASVKQLWDNLILLPPFAMTCSPRRKFVLQRQGLAYCLGYWWTSYYRLQNHCPSWWLSFWFVLPRGNQKCCCLRSDLPCFFLSWWLSDILFLESLWTLVSSVVMLPRLSRIVLTSLTTRCVRLWSAPQLPRWRHRRSVAMRDTEAFPSFNQCQPDKRGIDMIVCCLPTEFILGFFVS